eukprot:2254747-Rhodomonas_salina.1
MDVQTCHAHVLGLMVWIPGQDLEEDQDEANIPLVFEDGTTAEADDDEDVSAAGCYVLRDV